MVNTKKEQSNYTNYTNLTSVANFAGANGKPNAFINFAQWNTGWTNGDAVADLSGNMTGTPTAITAGLSTGEKIFAGGVYSDEACTELSGIFRLQSIGGAAITLQSIAPAAITYPGGNAWLVLYIFDEFSSAESNFIYKANTPNQITGLKHYKTVKLPIIIKN